MKIAMVSMNAAPQACLGDAESGGQSVVIDCLSRALSVGGHDVTVHTQNDDPPLPDCSQTAAGVRVSHVSADAGKRQTRFELQAAIETFRERLAAKWSLDRPDVVHAHSWMSGKAAVEAARPLSIPVVQTFHGLGRARRGRADGEDPECMRLEEEAVLVRAAARIVATSSAEVFALLEMGANPRAIKFIPCGVDLDMFAPLSAGLRRAGPFRVATLSRLVPDAGVGDVIDALRYIDDIELTIGGGSRYAPNILEDRGARELEALAQAGGIAARVTFAGRVERSDVAEFLRSADVVVCAPWYDSIGTVALEAMACGVPVVVSAVGGHVDAVADGLSGLHVPARAPRQIAYALGGLKADAVLRERFIRNGIERTAARYGWPRIAAETYDVYMTVADRAGNLTRSGT